MVSKGNTFVFLPSGLSLHARTSEVYLARGLVFTQLGLLATITKAALTVAVNKMLIADSSVRSMEEALSAMSRQNLFVLGIEFVFSWVLGTITQLVIIQVVTEIYMRKRSTWKGRLTVAYDRFASTFGFGLLYAVCSNIVGYGYNYDLCFLASIIAANTNGVPLPILGAALVAFAVYAFPFVTLVLPIVAIEPQSPQSAIKRAFELGQGYRWYIYNSMHFPILMTILISPFLFATRVFSALGMAPFVAGVFGIVYVPLQTV